MLYEIRDLVKQRRRGDGYRLLIRNFFLPEGARIAITGPSGCGKSTTLDILGLILKPDAAEVFSFSPAQGKPVEIMPIWAKNDQDRLADLRLANMAYVLQTGDLLPFLNVYENILMPARLAGHEPEESSETARMLAERLGIEKLFLAMPATLSVGERQRAAIVRALVAKPRLILADEPTAALDPRHADQVMAAFLDALDSTGATLVVVTHNASWASQSGLVEASFQLRDSDEGINAILDYKPERLS